MKLSHQNQRNGDRGFALIMVTIFSALSLFLLGGAMVWSSNNTRLNDRSNEFYTTQAAAEAATEKVLTHLMKDFRNGGESLVAVKLNTYRLMTPTSSENQFWGDYEFTDAQGGVGKTYLESTGTREYLELDSQYSGLNGFVPTYRIISTAIQSHGRNSITAAVQQDVQLASIPIFQFAIFYNDLMEFTWSAPITVRGRVHGNADIYTGSSAPQIFEEDVTSVGINQKTPWWGFSLSQFTGNLQFNGQKETNTTALTLPIGTNMTSNAVREVLNPPPAGESIDSPMGKQRYYNKAEMVVTVNPNSSVTTTIKTPFAASGVTLPYSEIAYFLTGDSLTDQRENKYMKIVKVDVAKYATWAATNSAVATVLAGAPPNVLYIDDNRSVTSSQLTGVKLINGKTLPSRGLTVATPDPLYVVGHFNCPNNSHLGTTNTTQTRPASLVSDALTILSSNWDDSKSNQNFKNRPATHTTVNAAILTGAVESVPGATYNNNLDKSGGVMNLPRLLEDWGNGSDVLTINGSLVNLFYSAKATAPFLWPGYYYYAPSRNFNFDRNFKDVTKLPPGSPELRVLIRGKWLTPPKNTVNYSANILD